MTWFIDYGKLPTPRIGLRPGAVIKWDVSDPRHIPPRLVAIYRLERILANAKRRKLRPCRGVNQAMRP